MSASQATGLAIAIHLEGRIRVALSLLEFEDIRNVQAEKPNTQCCHFQPKMLL